MCNIWKVCSHCTSYEFSCHHHNYWIHFVFKFIFSYVFFYLLICLHKPASCHLTFTTQDQNDIIFIMFIIWYSLYQFRVRFFFLQLSENYSPWLSFLVLSMTVAWLHVSRKRVGIIPCKIVEKDKIGYIDYNWKVIFWSAKFCRLCCVDKSGSFES